MCTVGSKPRAVKFKVSNADQRKQRIAANILYLQLINTSYFWIIHIYFRSLRWRVVERKPGRFLDGKLLNFMYHIFTEIKHTVLIRVSAAKQRQKMRQLPKTICWFNRDESPTIRTSWNKSVLYTSTTT